MMPISQSCAADVWVISFCATVMPYGGRPMDGALRRFWRAQTADVRRQLLDIMRARHGR